jgi:copper homeostasis protein
MNNKILIEVCVDNAESAIAASKAGADRLELCSALSEGGLTPSKGLIEYVVSHVKIPVFALIRPRSGDFLYSNAEYNVIKSDIFTAKVAGISGIVIGMLNSDGSIDTCRMKEVIEMCNPLPVTFHRAFDMAIDPHKSLEKVIELGCKRVLTSGGKLTAAAGSSLISFLAQKAAERISIMPGAGINKKNLPELIEATGCFEYHLSGSSRSSVKMKYENQTLSEVFPLTFNITDKTKIEEICNIARSYSD